MARLTSYRNGEMIDPPITRFVFSDTRLAWIWLIVRLYMSYTWITSGWGKFTNPAWMNTGDALKNYWGNALKTDPRPVITFDWYRVFIQFLVDAQAYTWFAKIVVAGELLIGIALLLGVFTGIAALFGGFMNWNFMMAGTTSVNPVFFTLSILLILAWKTAGYWGVDRFLLPALGAPWKPGFIARPPERATGSALAE
ncbi:MAG: DoxX family membrane protein [Chloroflexi bacterium]|nr:DoxX family membrane protein [Chloroflexota bacterium]